MLRASKLTVMRMTLSVETNRPAGRAAAWFAFLAGALALGLGLSGSAALAATFIVDNADPTGVVTNGPWTSSAATPGYWGTNYLHDGNTNKGAQTVRFIPTLPSNGLFTVSLRWTALANRAPSVPVDIVHAAGTNTVFVNQTANNGVWMPLLTTNFTAGTNGSLLIRTDGTSGYVIADAAQWTPAGLNTPPTISDIPNQSSDGTPVGPISFTIGDTETSATNLTLSASSSDTTLVPLANLVFGGSGANRTLTVTPTTNVNGSATITVTVSDGDLTASDTFLLTVASSSQASLLLRYTFDEATTGATTALDSGSAPSANGTFNGAATRTNDTPGAFTTASLNLNGVNGTSHYVSAGNPAKLNNLTNFTLVTWLNLRGDPAGNDRLIDKLSTGGGFGWKIVAPSSGSLNSGNFRPALHVNSNSGEADATVNISASNQWIFLAVTYDGGNVKFYSGATNLAVAQLGSSVSFARGIVTNTPNDLRVGSTPAATADRTPPAWFDDVRVYGAALSAGQLEAVRLENTSATPAFTVQPQSQTADAGSTVSFTALATGSAPLNYQWFFGAGPVPNATNTALTLTNVSAAQAGSYFVVVTNRYGSATSSVATLALNLPGPPVLLGATASATRHAVLLRFDRSVADSATNVANFTLGGGLAPVSAALDPLSLSNLTVTTTLQAPNTLYAITVSGVRDRTTNAMLMASTNASFNTPPLYGPFKNAPESAAWTLLYSLTVPSAANYTATNPPYDIDHHLWATNFSRVAYYLELQQSNGPLQFVWAAMDAFSHEAAKLGVPTAASGALFQQNVANLDVRSSVAGIPTGTGLSGSVSFWPTNTGAMQIRNSGGQLLLAFNRWAGGTPEAGIGSTANASAFTVKRLLVFVLPAANAPVDADVVVYGGTSGGVAAAVQAARLGKRTVLLAFDNHLGGLSSGGLGWTDTGDTSTIGGLAREFYRRNGARYGESIRYNLEPHAAEQLYGQMLAEVGVTVVFNQHLASLAKTGQRITQVTMDDGSVYRGKMFVDTTYEGDLIAMARVSFTVGREGTNTYGESYAGVLAPGSIGIDPYVVPGNPASGLLPLLQPDTGDARGSGDSRVQAYNYRMCFAQNAANFLPMTAPVNYDETQFELLARYLEHLVATTGSATLGTLMTIDRPCSTGKYDINNNGSISTDFVGESWTWSTNTYAARAVIRQAHEDYTRGFFTFLATSPRSPASLRAAMLSWGMCKDEFLDTGGWPHALYVREGRRMVSDYVMTQANAQGTRLASDSVALASYSMDSHLLQRIARGGVAMNEGGMYNNVPNPFPISYRSIIPRAGECENVFATFALAASHAAYASCRMEPVFMMVSQSAGTAAAFAIDDRVSVQQLSYPRLALQLQADGQFLGNGTGATDSGIIVDDSDSGSARLTGDWLSSSSITGYWGEDYLTDGNTNKGACSVTFTPTLPSADTYEVYLRWTANPNRDDAVPVDIVHPGGTNTFLVNQQANGGAWVLLLKTNFNAGTNARVVIRNDGTTGYVIADAVRFLSSNAPPCTVQVVASVGSVAETSPTPARLTFVRTGDTNSALTLAYTLTGTASNGLDYTLSPALLTVPAGATLATLLLTPLPDALAEGDETVLLTLQPGTNYAVGALATATVTLLTTQTPQITGQVQLEGYVGTLGTGVGTRPVTFKATDDAGTVLSVWTQTLVLLPGTNGCGVGNFTLANVPTGTTHLSAKTQWHLRQRQPVTFTDGQAQATFLLRGGDFNDSNLVDIEDYFHLAAAWYSNNDAVDIDGSGRVDFADFYLLSDHWYQQGDRE